MRCLCHAVYRGTLNPCYRTLNWRTRHASDIGCIEYACDLNQCCDSATKDKSIQTRSLTVAVHGGS